MRRALNRFVLLAVLGSLLLAVVPGCTTERDPIYRAPYEALDKRMFQGEFFYKSTTTDLPYTVDYAFIGETTDTMVIRWEITKNWLVAYNIHDMINARTSEGDYYNNRTPVLALPILLHFDIRFAENPITGEDLPIQTVNQDMDWHEAPYFMVDPSRSGISVFPDAFRNLIYQYDQPFSVEALAGYWEMEFHDAQDNYLDPRRFREMQAADPSLAVDEISFYNEALYTPNVSLWGWWSWTPDEWFFRLNYEPARVRYRHVFKRVDRQALAQNGFVPVDMDDFLFRRFGYFRSNYVIYDHVEGMPTDATWYKFANYFNTEVDPATGRPRMIEYYLNGTEFPRRLVPAACSIAVDYNRSFRRAATVRDRIGAGETVYESELPDLISNPAEWDELEIQQYWNTSDPATIDKIAERCLGVDNFFDDGNDVFALRANAFAPYVAARDGVDPDGAENAVWVDPFEHYPYVQLPPGFSLSDRGSGRLFKAACEVTQERRCQTTLAGDVVPRFVHRLGDVDSSFMYWVSKPTEFGILGVAQWSANPETGQTFSGVGHIAGAVLAWDVVRSMDAFDLMSGIRSLEDIIDPQHRNHPDNYVMLRRDAPFLTDDGANEPLIEGAGNRPASAEEMMRFAEREARRLPPLSGRLPLSAVAGTRWAGAMTDPALADWLFPGVDRNSQGVQEHLGPNAMYSMEGMWRQVRQLEGFTENCYFMSDWLDGVILTMVEERLAQRQALVDGGMTLEAATATIRADLAREFERLMFRGVAEHEVGHAVGLRHNFGGSTDELNFIGLPPQEDPNGAGSGYWPAQAQWKREFNQVRVAHRAATGRELHELGEAIQSQRNRYRYSSVMDYQAEPYIHAEGLGKYDDAALVFVYGRAVQKWEPSAGGGDYLRVRFQQWYNPDTGGAAVEAPRRLEMDDGGRYRLVLPESGSMVSVLDNGDVKPFIFCTDHERMEHAWCNVFDSGVTNREIARNMIRSYNKYYYYRFFRRGNPRFNELSWSRYLWYSHFPLAHFALDFNYNFARVDSWWEAMIDPNSTSPVRTSYLWALGHKESEVQLDGNGDAIPGTDFDEMVPARSIGDYLTASVEAFNFFLFDVIYRPDVGAYVSRERDDVPFFERANYPKMWVKNPYIVPDDRLNDYSGFESIYIGADVGRFHRSRWDIQDDTAIIEPRLVRRGFGSEKTAAIFILSNTGWPVEKYGRENMANGFHYASDGFRNAIFQLLSDVNNEDEMVAFTPYCIQRSPQGTTEPYILVNVNPPSHSTWLWNAYDRFDYRRDFSRPYRPQANFCATVDSRLEPMQAGWIYFDKLWPTMWATYGLGNISADQTVYQYFTADVIPVDRYHDYEPLDPVNEAEFLNTANRFYYRARRSPDGRPTPAFELIQKGARVRQICEERTWDSSVSPNDTISDCPGWRTLETMEATLVNNDAYGRFWSDIMALEFGK